MGLTVAAETSFVVTRWWAAVLALVILVGSIVAVHVAVTRNRPGGAREQGGDAVAGRRQGIKGLVIGSDGRASTSKVQVVLWTAALLYALVFLLLWGRSMGCDATAGDVPACEAAADAREVFRRVVDGGMQPEYFALLGLPVAAALGAKAITTAKVAENSLHKPPIGADQRGVVQGFVEVMTNDAGETDVLDLQYFAFNLLTLAYFFSEFLTKPAGGLPSLPPTLIALAGLSTAGYTTKKALAGDPEPRISSIRPGRVELNEGVELAISGANFGPGPVAGGGQAHAVMFEGVTMEVVSWTDSEVRARLAPGDAGVPADLTHARVHVVDGNGVCSPETQVAVSAPPGPHAVATNGRKSRARS